MQVGQLQYPTLCCWVLLLGSQIAHVIGDCGITVPFTALERLEDFAAGKRKCTYFAGETARFTVAEEMRECEPPFLSHPTSMNCG